MHRLFGAVVVTGVLVCASAASAQGFSRVWIDVDFGLQVPAQKNFTATITPTIFLEPASYSAAYELNNAGAFGIGGGIMLNKKFGVGVAYGKTNDSGNPATLNAHVPSPVTFNAYGNDTQPSADPMPRIEQHVHIDAMFVLMDNKKIRVRAFAGPSHVNVSQTQINNFSYTQAASGNTNTVHITSSTHVTTDVSMWGFNVGADVGYFFTKNLGAGGYVKYVLATGDLQNALPTGTTISIKGGGVQFGGAFFVRF